ncbi:MAG: serine--tRNA ligase [Candidatus Hydrogenedentes bacterium]|nr:serine--tRNA ligase [Candidatus Hydrogenedentota bacterium]
MLDMKFIREHPDEVRRNLENRNNAAIGLDDVLEKDAARRKILHETEQVRAEQNRASEEIARLKKAKEDAGEAIAAMQEVSKKAKALGDQAKAADEALNDIALGLPNLLHDSVPIGRDENDNRIERTVGEPPKFDFEPKDHVDLGEALGIFDFAAAARLARARFNLSIGPGARIERALINFMLDIQTKEHGYTEVLPPLMVNSPTMQGTGNLPKFAEDLFRLEGDLDLWLIPTAEVPLTNIHAGQILEEKQLPIFYTAYTPCFRSEAGSHGKDTRGMLRQHQFNKVELVKLTNPEDSFDELEKLTANAETILQRLEIPYRVVTLCSGDTGFSAAKTYDIEVWLPGQDTYREISSCSNCTDFQARRANIRFRRKGRKKPEFVHTLNGSGGAVGRTVIALLENFQNEDGSITIPEALRPYMDGLEKISG